MDSNRWDLVQSLFHDAATRPEAERRAYVEHRCGSDASLVDEVLTLLAADAGEGFILDRGIAGAASGVFAPAGATLPLGEFGAYRVRHVIGEGGMGVVYLAERADLGTVAAIKLLRDAWVSPARRERFIAEQRLLAQLQHPGIARLYDAGSLPDGTPWFVMEYVEGETITAWCRSRDASVRERLRIFREVCEAVLHAHGHLVIHRDLKPSNVMVRADGSVALLDFGIAKQLENIEAPVDQTRTGVRLMTPAYAAPEQILGEPVGLHTDVYSLGVVLYELLAGRLPFDLTGHSSAEVERIVIGQEPERPSLAAQRDDSSSPVRGVSRAEWADLDVLALTAMRKDPLRRYRSVDALVRDIDHFLRGEPLEARPDSARYRAAKFVRRHRSALGAAAVVLATIVALVSFYTVRLAAARDAAVAQAARAERIQRITLNIVYRGDDAAGPADSLRVVSLLDRGLLDARALSADPAAQGELAVTLGGIYQKLGKLDRADSLFGAALAYRARAASGDDAETAHILAARGLLRSEQARYPEAESLVTRALDMDQRLFPATHPEMIRTSQALGTVLRERGAYDRAISTFEGVVQARAAGTDTVALAESLHDLASTHFYAGHFAATDSLDRAALALFRRVYGDRHPRISEVLVNLGAVQHEQARYADAAQSYQAALAITRGWYGNSHPTTASNLTMLARTYVRQDKLADADSLLRTALAIREQVYGPMHPAVASTVNEIGSVALRRKQYDEADSAFRRMLHIYRTTYGPDHYLLGIATSNIGSVYSAREDYPRAEQMYRDAIRIFLLAQGPAHLNVGIARVKLGRVLLRQGRLAEGERESRAGYDILIKIVDTRATWLMNARADLATLYDSLHRPADAARFRAELGDSAANRPR